MIASNFDDQTLSAVAWLIANNVDISCFKLTPVNFAGNFCLKLEKVLPLSKLSDFYVDITGSQLSSQLVKTNKKAGQKTSFPRMKEILEWEIIQAGDMIKIKSHDNSEAKVIDEKYVEYKEEKLSFNQWGQKVTGWSAINIYEWTIPLKTDKTLHELRINKQMEIQEAQNMETTEDC